MASKTKKKPPTTSSPRDDARLWREGTAAPRDAEIDFRLRHVLAEAPLDQILDALDLRPGVGAGLALAGHGCVVASAAACGGGSCFGTAVPFFAFGALVVFCRSRRLAIRFPREPGQR